MPRGRHRRTLPSVGEYYHRIPGWQQHYHREWGSGLPDQDHGLHAEDSDALRECTKVYFSTTHHGWMCLKGTDPKPYLIYDQHDTWN